MTWYWFIIIFYLVTHFIVPIFLSFMSNMILTDRETIILFVIVAFLCPVYFIISFLLVGLAKLGEMLKDGRKRK